MHEQKEWHLCSPLSCVHAIPNKMWHNKEWKHAPTHSYKKQWHIGTITGNDSPPPLQWLGHGQGRPLPLAFISAIVTVFVVPSMPCVTAVCTQWRTTAMSTEPLVHHKKNSDCLRKCQKKSLGKNRGSGSYQGRPSALLSPVAPTTHPRHRDVNLRRQLVTESAYIRVGY